MRISIGVVIGVLISSLSVQAGQSVVSADGVATPEQAAIIARALPDEYHGASYTVGTADLNGDGKADLLVHFNGDDWCSASGQGCQATVILSTPGGYADHDTTLPMFGDAVKVLPSMHHGLHDLRFDDATHVFKFDGNAYQ